MGVLLMILLDEHMQLVHDEEQQPSGQLRESLIRCNSMCAYASKDLLYRGARMQLRDAQQVAAVRGLSADALGK